MEVKVKLNYIVFSFITLIVSIIGRFYVSSGIQWYYTLKLPAYTPPNWFIGSIWTVIYVLTTVAVILVWNNFKRDEQFWAIMGLFVLNALFNLLWTYLFFYKHSIGLAFLDDIALFITLLLLVVTIGQRSLLTASLLVPYLGWIAFATWLNLMIWFMN